MRRLGRGARLTGSRAGALRAILPLAAALALPAGALAAQEDGAGVALDTAVLRALPEGARIRASGPAIREALPLTITDILRGGITAAIFRPPAEGTVVAATPTSIRFVELRRGRTVDAPWTGVRSLDLHEGRSPVLGLGQGAFAGALTGLVLWGTIEFIFMAADNPVVENPEHLIGIAAGAGALFGAATMGDHWRRVYP